MENFVKVCATSDVPEGEMKIFTQGSTKFLIGNKDGKFFSLLNQCPHASGSLGDGMIDSDGYVMCHLHSWRFDHQTGKCPDGQNCSIPIFEIKEKDGDIYINEKQLAEQVL